MNANISEKNFPDGISIGDLSKFTGMEVARLRMWEKRYGRPKSERRPSGHRRYGHLELQFMLLISEALEKGYRIGQIIKMDDDELSKMVRVEGNLPENKLNETEEPAPSFPDISLWLEAVMGFRDRQLIELLNKTHKEMGSIDMIQNRIKPFMEHIGHLWEKGLLHVGHEHFASNCIQDYLKQIWRSDNHNRTKKLILAAMLPGDDHILGLNMVCSVLAQAGYRVLYLGHRAPIEAIIATTKSIEVRGLVISIPKTTNWKVARDWLTEIRSQVSKDKFICMGGAGAIEDLDQIERKDDLNDFYNWLIENNS